MNYDESYARAFEKVFGRDPYGKKPHWAERNRVSDLGTNENKVESAASRPRGGEQPMNLDVSDAEAFHAENWKNHWEQVEESKRRYEAERERINNLPAKDIAEIIRGRHG